MSCWLSTTKPHLRTTPSNFGPQLPFSCRSPPSAVVLLYHPCPNSFCINGRRRGVSKVVVDTRSTLTLLFDLEPFFVVMIITPDAALEPYSAAAEPPCSILIDSISLGLISLPRLPKSRPPLRSSVPICPLLTGTPSTTYNG